ncbi:MAG: translesion DNA synthesis-associated protein ImuA [Verrucomicrobiota bacterium]
MKEALSALLAHPGVWRGDGVGAAPGREVLPTGHPALDGLLPGGGWPANAATEILFPREGIGELRLLLPVLADLSREGRRVAWVDPPHLPYVPALAAAGTELSRFLVVRTGVARDRFFAVEQCLRSGACGAVLAWPETWDDRSVRRLQLAAEKGGSLGVLFRPERGCGRSSAAALRLRVAPSSRGLVVEILKGRGGAGRSAVVPLAGSRKGEPRAGCLGTGAVHA